MNLSLNKTLLIFLLYDRLTSTNWFEQFLWKGLFSFHSKGFPYSLYGLAVYVKEVLLFVWDLSSENSDNSYLCFWMALLHVVCYSFFLYWSSSSSFCIFFMLFYLTWSNGLMFRVLDFQSRGRRFKTTKWCQGRLSLSLFQGQSKSARNIWKFSSKN